MKIGLAIPIVDSVDGEGYYTHLMLAAKIAGGGHQPVIMQSLNVFPHDRAREYLMDQALKMEVERIVWLDSDVVVPSDAFEKLMLTMDESKAAMVSAHAYQRGYPYYATWSKYNEITKQVSYCDFVPNSGIHEVDSSGFSLCLFDMKWCKLMDRPFFQMRPRESDHVSGGAVWEDAHFCYKLREAGGVILAHTGVRCGHLGFRTAVDDSNVEYLRKRDYDDGGTTNY